MAKIAFSDATLRSLPLPERGQSAYWDEKLPSFGLRVSQGGSKTFVLNRGNNFITLGRYGVLTLSEARTEAKRLLAEFTLGKVRPQSLTYAKAVGLFLEEKTKSRRSRTVSDYKRLLALPSFHGQLSDITHDEAARQIGKVKAPSEHNHALVAANVFFNWCQKRHYIENNPFRGLSTHSRVPRARVLSDRELQLIWQATEEPKIFHAIVRLLILSGQRCGEIAALQASFFKDMVCTLPSTLTKNGREHSFPIGKLTHSLVSPYLTSEINFLFPARGKSSSPFNGWSKSKAALDKASAVPGWTLHDLRRTYASKMAELGIAPHVIERLLNHVSGTISGVAAIYNRYQFMPEMRSAVEKYEQHIADLIRS